MCDALAAHTVILLRRPRLWRQDQSANILIIVANLKVQDPLAPRDNRPTGEDHAATHTLEWRTASLGRKAIVVSRIPADGIVATDASSLETVGLAENPTTVDARVYPLP